MDKILFYILYEMRSIDGNRDSAVKLLELKNEESRQSIRREKLREIAYKVNEQQLYFKALRKYKFMRIRSKISFSALKRKESIMAVFVKTIISTLQFLKNNNIIKKPSDEALIKEQSILREI